MKNLFEYSDILNSPIEAFYCESKYKRFLVESHWHYFVEILYIESGSVGVTCNENVYHLTSGQVIFLPPQAVHSIYNDCDENFKLICVKFNANRIHLVGDYLPNLNASFREISKLDNPPIVFSESELPKVNLTTFFSDIVDEVNKKYYGYNSYVYSKLSELILKFLRFWYYKGISFETEVITESDDYSIQDALLYIDEHCNENINITELASMCNMSYSYFAKVFHKQYGQSCKQYIEFIRLNKVENLLLFTDYDLSTISNEMGFADCSHLIRIFKKRYMMTPKQFRQKHQIMPIRMTM